MSTYIPTIGLEIHAELKTQTKMFCASKNDSTETRPNVNVCPICLAHPGTLPTINKEAVRHVLRVGVAVGGRIADFTEFDRKNYFYPDIPKGYQISQYEFPLVSGGELAGVSITRIHLEEDTARSSHDSDAEYSFVDFNRAGVPLMELVTEPVMHDARDAVRFGRELQLLLRTLNVSDADMEKGHMRVEANISVSATDEKNTSYVEVKNLNSFRAVERAIEFEIRRQTRLLESGEGVKRETRGWDENAQKTFPQRTKERAADYRYFPDPDLSKLRLSEIPEFSVAALTDSLPELPEQKRRRFRTQWGIKTDDIEMYVHDPILADFFEKVAHILAKQSDAYVQRASNYIINNLVALDDDGGGHVASVLDAHAFADVVRAASDGDISSNAAVEIMEILVAEPNACDRVDALIDARRQKNDKESLRDIVDAVISENESVVAEYRAGKEAALKFLIGQGMKISRGSANPEMLQRMLRDRIA